MTETNKEFRFRILNEAMACIAIHSLPEIYSALQGYKIEFRKLYNTFAYINYKKLVINTDFEWYYGRFPGLLACVLVNEGVNAYNIGATHRWHRESFQEAYEGFCESIRLYKTLKHKREALVGATLFYQFDNINFNARTRRYRGYLWVHEPLDHTLLHYRRNWFDKFLHPFKEDYRWMRPENAPYLLLKRSYNE